MSDFRLHPFRWERTKYIVRNRFYDVSWSYTIQKRFHYDQELHVTTWIDHIINLFPDLMNTLLSCVHGGSLPYHILLETLCEEMYPNWRTLGFFISDLRRHVVIWKLQRIRIFLFHLRRWKAIITLKKNPYVRYYIVSFVERVWHPQNGAMCKLGWEKISLLQQQ